MAYKVKEKYKDQFVFVEIVIGQNGKSLIYPRLIEGVFFPVSGRDLLQKIYSSLYEDIKEFCYNEMEITFDTISEDIFDILFNSYEREPLFIVKVIKNDSQPISIEDKDSSVLIEGKIRLIQVILNEKFEKYKNI